MQLRGHALVYPCPPVGRVGHSGRGPVAVAPASATSAAIEDVDARAATSEPVIAEPERQPLPGGGDRWVTPAGGASDPLSRRVW